MARRMVWCVLLALCSAAVLAQEVPWEIEPKSDSRLPAGKLSFVGGETDEDGVHFRIKNLDLMQPIELALAAEDAAKPVTLLVYKDSPQQPLLERTTEGESSAVATFRTTEEIDLLVKGPAGAKYQLMTWVGPVVELPAPTALVPIDATGSPLVEGIALTPPASTAGAAEKQPATTQLAIPTSVTVLLALILAALVVLIVVLARGRGKAKGTSAVVVLLCLLGAAPRSESTSPIKEPKNLSAEDVRRALNQDLQKLREKLEALEKGGIKTDPEALKIPKAGATPAPASFDPKKVAGQYVTSMKLLLAFLEQFGLIDPREAAVAPNYNPPGQPLIPSRCAGTGDCGACFYEANAKLDKSRKLLEDMYVIYKQTELKAGRIHEMANAAAGLSPYAQMAWTAIKNNPSEPMNVAQKKFYDTYDTNLGKLLTMANEGLIGIGACEREHFKDYDWYPRYGMIYYNFLRDRYTRK